MNNQDKAYLFGPRQDFLLLGGGSIIALIFIRIILPPNQESIALSLELTIFLSNIINHPHFAASYLIFYENFSEKIFSKKYEFSIRIRYFLFGILAPAAIIFCMSYCVISNNVIALGIFSNVMFLLVGWHYVKQGYGMAMLDAALKRCFFSEHEKKILLRNTYSTWIFAWVLINFLAKNKEPSYFGIPYVAIPIPDYLIIFFGLLAGFTAVNVIIMIYKKIIKERRFAWNGIVAYGVSIYAWLLIRDPIVILWVPLFHSLQYLAVVWRFKSNKFSFKTDSLVGWKYKLAAFFAASIMIGYYMFFQIPSWLDANIKYDKSLFGGYLFFFLFWIFINIHHYLLDTVMWRKNNPDVRDNLFLTSGKK